MKNISFNKLVLIFFLALVILFWMMPNGKVETIGDFCAKVITPLSYPLSIIIGTLMSANIITKIIKSVNKVNKKK